MKEQTRAYNFQDTIMKIEEANISDAKKLTELTIALRVFQAFPINTTSLVEMQVTKRTR
jgi:hypothetical protein